MGRRRRPYHSQNTEPWFYRTPGLKIVVPSTPHDARAATTAYRFFSRTRISVACSVSPIFV